MSESKNWLQHIADDLMGQIKAEYEAKRQAKAAQRGRLEKLVCEADFAGYPLEVQLAADLEPIAVLSLDEREIGRITAEAGDRFGFDSADGVKRSVDTEDLAVEVGRRLRNALIQIERDKREVERGLQQFGEFKKQIRAVG